MKAKNFRLGNFLYNTEGKLDTVGMEAFRYLLEYGGTSLCQAKPIPLTEEWLMKFGFEKQVLVNENNKVDYLFLNTNSDFFDEGLYWQDGVMTNYEHIKYVHQLQNLYFALTQEELEIKE